VTSVTGSVTAESFDVAILGSGFAGSLTSWILQSTGLRTVLIDRDRHPRFAVGESSTPAANLILRSLASEYGLQELNALSRFGSWRQTWPHMRCGLKRGFSYFAHRPGEEFVPDGDGANQLLVAASSCDALADTQWYRADVDEFLSYRAVSQGAVLCEEANVCAIESGPAGWEIRFSHDGTLRTLKSDFIIDASGAGQVLMRHSCLEPEFVSLRTRTRSLFTHVEFLPEWHSMVETVLPGGSRYHPFHCDHSALHHLLEEGWMWWLRFHDGLTSVGLVLDERMRPFDAEVSAATEWNAVLSRYPSLQRAVGCAKQTRPELVRTRRLQRLNRNMAGADWVLLPAAAGFVDPLHSTGLAHSLAGVERVVRILIQNPAGAKRTEALQGYATAVVREFEWIDELVSGAGVCRGDFRKFTAFLMCYFAAATNYERRRLDSPTVTESGFLCAADDPLREAVRVLGRNASRETAAGFEALCERVLQPFNHAGLFSPEHPNMYQHTVLPE